MPKKRADPDSQSEESMSDSEQISSVSSDKKRTKKIAKPKEKTPAKKTKPKAKESSAKKSAKQQEAKKPVTKTAKSKEGFITGQRYALPPENDGAAEFYTTLFKQNQKSDIARKYVIDYGLLEEHEALKIIKDIEKNKKKGK